MENILLLVTAILLNLSARVTSNESSKQFSCRSHLCNEIPGFTQNLIHKFDSRFAAYEKTVMKLNHVRSCVNSSKGIGTMILVTRNQSSPEKWSTENEKHVWLSGTCSGNISIFLGANPLMKCSMEQLKKLIFQNSVPTHIPSRINVMGFAECMVHLFFKVIADESSSSVNLLMDSCDKRYTDLCSLRLALNYTPSIIDNNEFLSTTSVYNDSTAKAQFITLNQSNSESKPPLQKHHGGGGSIPTLLITLICTICGGSCLTFLICFRQIRHIICSCCNLCREANHYSRFFNDE